MHNAYFVTVSYSSNIHNQHIKLLAISGIYQKLKSRKQSRIHYVLYNHLGSPKNWGHSLQPHL